MKDFDINEFILDKHYAIEASAGTGKTHNICEIVDKIAGGDNPIVPLENMLIVTYTEKAAGELKDRIREKLPNCDVDNASIYTIHSFCQSVIKEFGIVANLPLNLEIIDDSKLNDFTDDYIRKGNILNDISRIFKYRSNEKFNIDQLKKTLTSMLKKYYLDKSNKEDASIISLLQKDSSFEEDFEYVMSIYNSINANEIISNNHDIQCQLESLKQSDDVKIKKLYEIISNNVLNNFDFNGNEFKSSNAWPSSKDKTAFDFFKNLKDKLKGINLVDCLAHKYIKDFYLKWQEEKEKNKSQTFDDMIRYVRERILEENSLLKERLKNKYTVGIIDEFQDTNQKQFDIFKSIFMSDTQENGAKNKKHYLIVVGDPKQSIYSFQGADVRVYQKAVDEIKEAGGSLFRLSKNWRSSGKMVRACNALFNHYEFDGTTFEPSEQLQEPNDPEPQTKYDGHEIEPVWIAHKNGNTDDNFLDNKGEEFARIAVNKIIECCSFINDKDTRLKVSDKGKPLRNVSYKDFTILAKTSSEMLPIQKALKNAGIPYIRYKDNTLYKGIECAHWIALLEAINTNDFTGKNRNKFKKALFTRFFGKTLFEINDDKYNHDDIEEIIKINNWRSLAISKRWEDLFDSIIEESDLKENSKTVKEIQSFSIFKQIANNCIEYLYNGHSLDSLIRNLTNLSRFELDDPDGSLVEKGTDFNCVKIMTMHASKGLQFPVVIAVGGFKRSMTQGKGFTYHNANGNLILVASKIDKINDNIINNEEEAEWKRLFYVAFTRAQNLMILPFYDKFGKDFLFTSLAAFEKDSKEHYKIITFEDVKNISFEDLKNKSRDILSKNAEITKNNNKINDSSDIPTKDNQRITIESVFIKSTIKQSYTSLSHGKEKDENNISVEDSLYIDNNDDYSEGLSGYDTKCVPVTLNNYVKCEPFDLGTHYPRGNVVGSALHEIFERLSFKEFENKKNIENNASLNLLIERRFKAQGMKFNSEWLEPTSRMVFHVLNAYLPEIVGSKSTGNKFKLNEISDESLKREKEFNFNQLFYDQTGEVIKDLKMFKYFNGFIDLLFKRNVEGKDIYSILDWKSDSLKEEGFTNYNDPVVLKNHVDDAYSIQRVLYTYCLIKWLNVVLKEQEKGVEYTFANHFGGIYYVFFRGCNENTENGIYAQTWNNFKDVEDAFRNITHSSIKEKKGEVK